MYRYRSLSKLVSKKLLSNPFRTPHGETAQALAKGNEDVVLRRSDVGVKRHGFTRMGLVGSPLQHLVGGLEHFLFSHILGC